MSMSIADYARRSKIPARVLWYLKEKGFIHDPLSSEDRAGLSLLEKTWCLREVLRPQLARFSVADRKRFIRTADLPTKWERYAYSRFRNHEAGKTLPMSTVIEEVEVTFGFKLLESGIEKLYRARNRAQVDRHREKALTIKKKKALTEQK
jgi:hypothetical protein